MTIFPPKKIDRYFAIYSLIWTNPVFGQFLLSTFSTIKTKFCSKSQIPTDCTMLCPSYSSPCHSLLPTPVQRGEQILGVSRTFPIQGFTMTQLMQQVWTVLIVDFWIIQNTKTQVSSHKWIWSLAPTPLHYIPFFLYIYRVWNNGWILMFEDSKQLY